MACRDGKPGHGRSPRLDDAAPAAISHRHFDGDTIKAQSIIDLRLTHTEILKPSPGHGHA
jgi:hypothetical protein